jgi:hypothetical protein
MSYLYNEQEIAYIKEEIRILKFQEKTFCDKEVNTKWISGAEYCHIENSIRSFQAEYGKKITRKQALMLMLMEDAIEYAKSLQVEFE